MKIRPVHNHIIAKKHVTEAKSTGGIILTVSGETENTHAVVLKIGPGFQSELNEGDIIIYVDGDKRVHTEKIDDEYILIMPEDCILGVIEQNNEQGE